MPDQPSRPTKPQAPKARPNLKPDNKGWEVLAFVVAQVGIAGLGAAVGLAMALSSLPDVSSLEGYVPFETSKIYDAKGQLVANLHGEENRVVVPLGEIPKHLQQAIIAVEDDRFYQHHGISPRGMMRALLTDIAEGGSVQGGSTLTQQLAKNLFLDRSKNVTRKLAEAWLAIQIEQRYSKDQILELYLNQVYWGHNTYGIEAAGLNYFGKHTRDLSLAESAMLAYLLRGPERYSPYRNMDLAKRGQAVALQRMVTAGFITDRQAEAAKAQPITLTGITSYAYRAPYFSSYLIQQLINRYGEDTVMKGGLRIHSTLDLDLQLEAERLLKESIEKNGKRLNFSQGAIVVLEPKTGFIRAMVGGVDYKTSKFNRVVQAYRQPGSSFKPFVYLAAFNSGLWPWTSMVDDPVSFDAGAGQVWSPKNYDGKHSGAMQLRKALERSNNVIAVKLAQRVGLENVIETAHTVGLQSELRPNLSLALGTSEVTPLELASAYGVFAAEGWRTEPLAYSKVEDRSGTLLEQRNPKLRQVYEPNPVRILNDVLQGVVKWGTGAAANIGRPAAGKTGTTSDHRDAWFVGYTPDLVAVVWVGNDDNSQMRGGTTGGGICAPIWNKVMRVALKDTKPTTFTPPELPEAPSTKPATDSEGVPLLTVPVDGGGSPSPSETPHASPAEILDSLN
ncbi:Penicillin-binding protein 2D [compost metagenome]